MLNELLMDKFYLNATHQLNSLAAQLEVASMLLHPYSREQKLQQIKAIHQNAVLSEVEIL